MDKLTHHGALQFFIQVIEKKPDTLEAICHPQTGMYFTDPPLTLIFSLPKLHQHLCADQHIDYRTFRQGIYQGNINEILGQRGHRIIIHRHHGHIDKNEYKLTALSPMPA